MSQTLLFVFELMGTIAFAASGAITALSKKMDIFGVATLGVVTAVGGGVIRDIILCNNPPVTFRNPVYAIVAIVVSVILFIPAVRRFLFKNHKIYERVMLIMDSAGLGIFTVVGIETSILAGHSSAFLLIFVGMITGVGGGVIRDILAGNKPYVFVKHFYACASLIGAIVCIALWRLTFPALAISSGALVVFILRLLAARFHWSLPKAEDIDELKEKGD